jgi:hypothetical protein
MEFSKNTPFLGGFLAIKLDFYVKKAIFAD